ncbi:MAG TPA: polysaccharide biosynthesis tyrosine autokinase [Chitinophagaceae bacterium]|nr:polysaccharide biosynthesis tyrosine autokinase [Chitinophagaceae bacterium]
MEETHINPNYNPNKSDLSSLSFRDLFYKYIRFLPVFILSVALMLLGAYLYLRWTVPVYSASGSMIIKDEGKNRGAGDKVEELFSSNKAQNIQSEIEILKSRPLMQRVVMKLNLQFSYYAIGKVKTINVYNQGPFLIRALNITDSSQPFIFKIRFVNDTDFRINEEATVYHFGQEIINRYGSFVFIKNVGLPANNIYSVQWVPTFQAAGGYASTLQIMPKTIGTGILNISMRCPNPHLGSAILNGLMEEYGAYSLEQKKLSSDQILAFIEGRLVDIGTKLDSVQRMYLDYQTRYNMIDADVQSSSYFGIINESDKTINEQNYRISVAEKIDEYLSDKKNAFAKIVVPSTLGLDDPTLNDLVNLYNKVQLERKQLVDGNVPAGHPLVKDADNQVEKIRLSIRENIRNINKASADLVSDVRKRSNLGEEQLRAMPVKIKELAEIKRQVETYQDLFKLFTQKKEETAISRASNTPNSEIIDRSYPQVNPVKPDKRSIQAMAILLGLAIPALFIFVSEVLNDKVTTRFDIEKITQAPILGEIGHSYSESTLVVSKTTRSMVAEQFRIIRSNLQYVLNKKDKAVIITTSSFSGEGKSYVSTNMGAVLALAGKRTVILEFDIRKPKVLSGLGMSKGPGITNYLVGKMTNLEELIRPVPEHENLFVLGCGPVPPNPSEMLLDPRLDDMFNWLKNHFDIVIIDTAPVGMVSDAMTLSKFADCTLYLVRQSHTFKKQIALIDEFYIANKLPKVSIIINDVKLKPGYGYYGYGRYGYGYGYGYGSYYEEETAPDNFFERILAKLDIRRLLGLKKKKKKNK